MANEEKVTSNIFERAGRLFGGFVKDLSKSQEQNIGKQQENKGAKVGADKEKIQSNPTTEMKATMGAEDDALWESGAELNEEANLQFEDAEKALDAERMSLEEIGSTVTTEESTDLGKGEEAQAEVDEIIRDINSGEQYNWDSDEMAEGLGEDQYLDQVMYIAEEEELIAAVTEVEEPGEDAPDIAELTPDESKEYDQLMAEFDKDMAELEQKAEEILVEVLGEELGAKVANAKDPVVEQASEVDEKVGSEITDDNTVDSSSSLLDSLKQYHQEKEVEKGPSLEPGIDQHGLAYEDVEEEASKGIETDLELKHPMGFTEDENIVESPVVENENGSDLDPQAFEKEAGLEPEKTDPLSLLEKELVVPDARDTRKIMELHEALICAPDAKEPRQGGHLPLSGTLEKREKRVKNLGEGKAILQDSKERKERLIAGYQEILDVKADGAASQITDNRLKETQSAWKEEVAMIDRIIEAIDTRIDINVGFIEKMKPKMSAPVTTKEPVENVAQPSSQTQSTGAKNATNKQTGQPAKQDFSLFRSRAQEASEGAKASKGIAQRAMNKLEKLKGIKNKKKDGKEMKKGRKKGI